MKRGINFALATFCLIFGASISFVQAGIFTRHDSVEEIEARLAKLPEQGRHKTKAILYAELGTLLYRDGEMQKAAQFFEKALSEDTSASLRKHIYLYMGKSYESAGRLDKAIEAYEQAVQYDKHNWKRHRDLAGLYEISRLFPKAIESYQAALRLNPKDPAILLSLGRTWREYGFYRESELLLKKALDWGADKIETERELSLACEGRGEFDQAAMAWEHGDPESVADWARLVYLAALAGKTDLVEKGISQLKAKTGAGETLSFYKYLSQLLMEKPEDIFDKSRRVEPLNDLISSLHLEPIQSKNDLEKEQP